MRLLPSFKTIAAACLLLIPAGCGDNDGDDDVAEKKELIAIDQVPPAVLTTAKKHSPDLTFFAAAKDTFKGKPSFELRGKSKNGKIKELEIAPDGTFLGED